MAPFGTLYSFVGNSRTPAIMAVAKANGLELELVETRPGNNVPTDYEKIHPLGKIPAFVGADGYVLHECIAIAIYITSQNEKTTLLGKTKQDYASMLKWMSYFNTEVLPPIGGWFSPLVGRVPYNKKDVETSQKRAATAIKVLEEHFTKNTYLVGERITLADLFGLGLMSRGFEYFFDKEWRAAYPSVTRWYETVYNQPIYLDVAGPLKFIEKAIENKPPKKEQPKKEAAPKAAPKPKKEEEEEEVVEAPKPKHPLELLPKPSLPLDEWKRQYSNNDTPIALKWFWENYNPEEYSLWKVDYKYNDELTLTFMSSNLITGFFTRLEASRKYIFGCASVYGTSNDSVITGAFVIRGQDFTPAFDVAPDYESYSFTKLDKANPEDVSFIEDQWTWERPLNVNGKEYPWADGKVFK